MNDIRYLSAQEAAAELGVSRATLYAYVSRGLIRSEASAGPRTRLYRADDVNLLRERKGAGREPPEAGAQALAWGAPVLDSAITLIENGALYYRGRDSAELAATASLETVAAILWDCRGEDPFAGNPPPAVEADGPTGMDRCLALLARAAPLDLKALNLEPAGVARTGARLIRLLAAGMGGTPAPDRTIHDALAAGWEATHPAAPDLIRAALVLLADHELNASAFTVRCIASTGAAPYAAVTGGLCALQGPRHGGETARVAAMLALVGDDDPTAALAARLQRGERLSGFGHPLYPGGDPRARILLRRLSAALPDSPAVALGRRLADAARTLTEAEPNIDFALAIMGRALGLPADAPLGIFAVGRCAGWIAHAQEQYATRALIRPRSRYVGEIPRGVRGT